MRYKKSQTGLIKVIIIAIIIGILLSAVIFVYLKSIKKGENLKLCQLTFTANSMVSKGTLGATSTTLQCPADTVYITSKEKGKELPTSLVYRKLADQIYNCWYKVGSGDLLYTRDWREADNLCLVCSIVQSDTDINKFGFQSFLYERDCTKNPNIKYIDYFDFWVKSREKSKLEQYKKSLLTKLTRINSFGYNVIIKDEPYYIIFVQKKPTTLKELQEKAAGFLGFEEEDTEYQYIGIYETIPDSPACENLYYLRGNEYEI